MFATAVLDEGKQLKQVTIVKGIGAGCDDAVLRAIASYVFLMDPAFAGKRGPATVSIVAQFVLPKR